MAHFHHISGSTQNQSISNLVSFGQNPRLLTFWPELAHFHHISGSNQNQSISNLVSFGQNTKAIALLLARNGSFSSHFRKQSKSINFKFGQFWPEYQGYSLTFWPEMAHFHHNSGSNQNQSTSNLASFGQNTKAIALLFGQKSLIFITFHSDIQINQLQCW